MWFIGICQAGQEIPWSRGRILKRWDMYIKSHYCSLLRINQVKGCDDVIMTSLTLRLAIQSYLATKLSNTEVRDPVEDVIIWPTYCKINICRSWFRDFITDAKTYGQPCFKCRIFEIKRPLWTFSMNVQMYSLAHNIHVPSQSSSSSPSHKSKP